MFVRCFSIVQLSFIPRCIHSKMHTLLDFDKNYTDTIDYNAVAPNGSHPTGPNNIVGRDAHSQSTCYCSHHHSNDIAVQTLHSKRLQRYQYLSTSKTSLHSQPT
eukprot:547240_1